MNHRSQQFLLGFKVAEQGDLVATRTLSNPASGRGLDPTVAKLSARCFNQAFAGRFLGRRYFRQGVNGLVLPKICK